MKRFTTNQLSALPQTPGVYFFQNSSGNTIYIGKAINLRNRIKSYFKPDILIARTQELVKNIARIEIIRTESEFEALLLEAKLINAHKPKYNAIAKDDKHPLYIKITGEEYPKVRTCRREDDPKSAYFGPFPSGRTVTDTLKFLRRIFPYCTEKRMGKKACFYAHIKLCDPCPNVVAHLPKDQLILEKKRYRTNVTRIKHILQGKYKKVLHNLNAEMNTASKELNFEGASAIKRQIEQLNYLTQNHTDVSSYVANPNLYDDVRREELNALSKLLGIPKPTRIEGYDISNIQGTHATGSMVVAINAEIDKGEYRKFRIRRENKPNDVAMMKEMIMRRCNHPEWQYPDLIVVDGGTQQVNAAHEALKQHTLTIPVIGLAKRLEEIIVPSGDNFIVIKIPIGSPALKLLQRIRDEAHRFAKKYHTLLRSKSMVN